MAFTTHGKHIPGTSKDNPHPDMEVFDCAGPVACPTCIMDSEVWLPRSLQREARPHMLSEGGMILKARELVWREFYEPIAQRLEAGFGLKDVYVVWFSKTLQNWKALVSTNVEDNRYYEVTYNGDKKETYVDCYGKLQNVRVPDPS